MSTFYDNFVDWDVVVYVLNPNLEVSPPDPHFKSIINTINFTEHLLKTVNVCYEIR